jgi:hypothetical protein
MKNYMEIPWNSMEFHGKFHEKIRQMCLWDSTEFHGTEVDGSPWIREFTEFDGIRFRQGI